MTYQAPPPPPPGAYPPGPPAGPGKPAFDPKSINPMDWGILAAAFLTFIFSFFAFYTASFDYDFGPVSSHQSTSAGAWHGWTWFSSLLVLIALVAIVLVLFVPQVQLPIPMRLVILGLFALALVFTLIALAYSPYGGADGAGYSTGKGFSYWITLILLIAGTALSVLRLKATGGKLPWEQGFSMGAPGAPGAPGTPPPGGYPPPPPPMMPPPPAPPQQ